MILTQFVGRLICTCTHTDHVFPILVIHIAYFTAWFKVDHKPVSSVGMVTDYELEEMGCVLDTDRRFFLTSPSVTALGWKQYPVPLAAGALSPWVTDWDTNLTTHLHLELRSRMSRALPPLSPICSCCIA